jgi:hypothetical protein
VEQIYLCLDNDKAGHEACAKLLDVIPTEYAVNQIVPTKKDWNEVLVNRSGEPDENYCMPETSIWNFVNLGKWSDEDRRMAETRPHCSLDTS